MKQETLRELRRKSIHVIPGVLAIPVVVWLGNPIATAIAAFFFALYAVHEAVLRLGLRVEVPIASHTFRVMARREELEGGYFTGTVYFWFSTLLIVALMEPHRAAASVMVSSFGDAAAAVVGREVGGPRLPFNRRKTLAGSAAMFLAAFASCLVAGVPLFPSLVASIVSTLAEAATTSSTLDELTVPAASALTLGLLA
ncbi:diacylglycerol/polyprenol kinase family protein [Thermofilum pendens]|uniref:Phosphatidate cytidylyltransferase n=1 Tax=Thermofilum pendens (strain DSM 2475 / Hrk 5) TaxID=368408 RepID=A1S067_THEPD|nr:diacylglycerol/polyprenol kinase family protein [Thermofilum pendens]ABL78847.1 phosphatidate cytidylyltransferase [Thermofilum pendens Hrk 5]